MNKFFVGLAVGGMLMGAASTDACTTILVGNEQTNDGSYLVARNEDYRAMNVKHFVIHPHVENQKGEFRSVVGNSFTYPLPEVSLQYTSVCDFDTENKSMGEVGFNELGVGFSGTESFNNGQKTLAGDPYDEEYGITEDAIEDVILPRAHTAKEGIQILGKIIEERGAGEGFGVALVDNDGIWYLETASGHRWMAMKMPNDKYFVSANQSRLRAYDATDTEHYMGSEDLVSFAVEHGLYAPQKGAFDFHESYGEDVERDLTYNYPRVWQLQKLLNAKLKITPEQGTEHPVFLTADKKISVNTVKGMLRDHYNGQDHDPYLHRNPSEPWRPISVFRTQESHVIQVRPSLPDAIGKINYLAVGMPSLSVYLPYYQGLQEYPEIYSKGTDEASDDAISWKYRKLQTLVMMDYNAYAPIVQNAYADFEAETATKQAVMERRYLDVYQTSPELAANILQSFENQVMQDALTLTEHLTNEIFTKLTLDTEQKYLFKGQ